MLDRLKQLLGFAEPASPPAGHDAGAKTPTVNDEATKQIRHLERRIIRMTDREAKLERKIRDLSAPIIEQHFVELEK